MGELLMLQELVLSDFSLPLLSRFYKPTMDTLCREATAAFATRDVEGALVTTSKLQYLKRMKQMLHHSIDVE